MKENLKVVELYKSNFRDIPATLRVIADEIENGEFGEVVSVTGVLDNGERQPYIFMLGHDTDPVFQRVGILQWAIQALINCRLKEGD